MSNKHSQGPRCPICRRYFRDAVALQDHQRARFHFPGHASRTDEEVMRARLQAYHQDKAAKS